VCRQRAGKLDQRCIGLLCNRIEIVEGDAAVGQLERRHAEEAGQHAGVESHTHARLGSALGEKRDGVGPGDQQAAAYPHQFHASVGHDAHRAGVTVGRPDALDQLAQMSWRRLVAVAHVREATAAVRHN
jgi:hypothetical protein